MIPIRISVLLLTFLLLLCTVSCSRREKSSPAAEVQKGSAPSEQRAAEGITKGTAAEAVESELIPLEAISSAATRDAKSGPLTLPANFGRRTGDLEQMIKERRIRALVVINPISFFYSHGKPNGMTYEMLEQLQLVVNQKFNTGKSDVKVMFLPMRPDELGPALMQGVGDIIAQGVMITPGRQESLAFTTPTKKNVTEN